MRSRPSPACLWGFHFPEELEGHRALGKEPLWNRDPGDVGLRGGEASVLCQQNLPVAVAPVPLISVVPSCRWRLGPWGGWAGMWVSERKQEARGWAAPGECRPCPDLGWQDHGRLARLPVTLVLLLPPVQ